MNPSDEAIFGPLRSKIEVRNAVKSTIEDWIETYLAVVERHYEIPARSLELPRSYVTKDDGTLDKRPEDQTPTIVILSPGTKGDPSVDGDGLYRIPYVVNVAAIVSARDHDATSYLAEYYSLAVRSLLVHNGTLGGFAMATVWEGDRSDDLRPEDDRTIAAGTNVFRVLVPDVVKKGAGLKAPPEEPYEEADPVLVKEVDVELRPEEITP